ncbi:hypothetical protein [Ruminococcus sp. HUN007]|uniref:hypothetical protein n=1 Tax=Ruminococcus sp. HUN007 TaxID=1514668 RepID=UPI0005D1B0F3|nr:hypothetical protein [Ruminococcus sp. HUN007]
MKNKNTCCDIIIAALITLLISGCNSDTSSETNDNDICQTEEMTIVSTTAETKKGIDYQSPKSENTNKSKTTTTYKPASYDDNDELSEGQYYCMGKNDTCKNKTYSPTDLYCRSCDPDDNNIEGDQRTKDGYVGDNNGNGSIDDDDWEKEWADYLNEKLNDY